MNEAILLIDSFDDLLPTHSAWDTAGGNSELATVTFLRGSILTSYGYIETLFNDLVLRSSKVPELFALSLKPPRTLGQRLSFLKHCFEIYAPLLPYRDGSIELIEMFSRAQGDRNDWAHGRTIVMPGCVGNRWQGATIRLELCSPKKTQFEVRQRPLTADDLVKHAKEVCAMAQQSQTVYEQAINVLPAY